MSVSALLSHFDEDNQALVIAKVHTGSPAEAAGLKVRDMIVGVDGQKVSDLGYDGTVSRSVVRRTTPVVLEIMRGTTAMTREIVRKAISTIR